MDHSPRITQPRDRRDARSPREEVVRSSLPSINQMENTMFEAMRKLGGYRVDYMNKENMGSPGALGFYVLGDLPARQPYSHKAKHSLLAGLIMLRNLGEIDRLVAIYLDVNEANNALRPAYLQMKRDIQAGLFSRLFVLDPGDLAGDSQTAQDWWAFTRQLKRIEVISWGGGELYVMPDIMLASRDGRYSEEQRRW